ncbi:Zinc finger protein 449 [Sciurus carolinensis]|uniref:Zinc finger protein 449 n=1 Tax=Sciurus carolinensis TaxID=30640 RepID=A0AA41MHI3_SCICA|nr:Zinc finger protein 449 [Sciurus carolinensis]
MTLRADAATEAAWLCKGDPMLHDHSNDCEVLRQHFRQFQYTEAAGPREAFSRLWELCCRWLKPKMRSMEQILELLVLEQFLTILPTEMESWVSAYGPESRERLLALIEDWQRQRHIPPLEVRQESGVWVILLFEYEVFPQSSSLNAGMFRGKMTRL